MSYMNEELEAEYNAQYGDPRRCEKHGCITSSPCGMFDAPCSECEYEAECEYIDAQLDEAGERVTARLENWTMPELDDEDDDQPF